MPFRSGQQSKSVARQGRYRALRYRPAGRGEQPGAQTQVLEDAVGGHQPQIGLVRRQCRELAAPLLGRRLVEAVQHDGVAAFAPVGEPFDGRRVRVEPVAALDPGCHQKRGGHVALVELLAERVDVGQCAVADPGNRDDQLSSHVFIVATSGVPTVYNTWAGS